LKGPGALKKPSAMILKEFKGLQQALMENPKGVTASAFEGRYKTDEEGSRKEEEVNMRRKLIIGGRRF